LVYLLLSGSSVRAAASSRLQLSDFFRVKLRVHFASQTVSRKLDFKRSPNLWVFILILLVPSANSSRD
jgi:hypothetical protein